MPTNLLNFIDISAFESVLYREAKASFIEMIEQYKNERIYMIGFYHSGSYSYILPIALTEKDIEDDPDMRWWECDAKHHGEFESGVEEADTLLNKFWNTLCDSDVPDSTIEDYGRFVEGAVASVFQKLEDEGVFDEIGPREDYILNLVCGDQGWDDKLRYAERVNPGQSLRTLRSDTAARLSEIERALAKVIESDG